MIQFICFIYIFKAKDFHCPMEIGDMFSNFPYCAGLNILKFILFCSTLNQTQKWLESNAFELNFSSVEFSSVAQSCPTLCNPINRSTPGLPVQQQLLDFT